MITKHGIISVLALLIFMVANLHFAPVKTETSFRIVMRPVFNKEPLILNSKQYITSNNDSIYIDACRFYISGLSLITDKNNITKENNSYHLIDLENESSLVISVAGIKPGNYRQISFNVGIDSLINVSGAMSGDLDPAKAMYWAWNSGYINAKLEGRSNACKTLHHAFEFHIGGYLHPTNTLRQITLPLKNKTFVDSSPTTLYVDVDVSAWFKNIDLKTVNSVLTPSRESMVIANNYANMFSIAQ